MKTTTNLKISHKFSLYHPNFFPRFLVHHFVSPWGAVTQHGARVAHGRLARLREMRWAGGCDGGGP